MSMFDVAAQALRGHWEAAMTDAVTVAPVTEGLGVYNTTTHVYDSPPSGTAVYTGKALVVPRSAAPGASGLQRTELVDVDVYLPHDATDAVEPHQLVTITTALLATWLVGQVLHIHEVEPLARNARTRLGCQLQQKGTP